MSRAARNRPAPVRLSLLPALPLAVAVVSVLPGAADGVAPARSSADALPSYVLDLRLDPEGGTLTGRAAVTLIPAAVADGTARFTVAGNGVSLEIERITAQDGPTLEHRGPDGDGIVEVDLADVATGAPTVVFEYRRRVDDAHREPFGYLVFAPFGPSIWSYPEIVLPDGRAPRFADFDVTLEHPDSWAVMTTGGHGGEGTIGDGRVLVRSRVEHVEGFAIVAGEGFAITRHEEEGVAIVAFYDPRYEEPFARVIDATRSAVDWYRRTYGFFPLEEVGIIQGHPRWGGGYPLPNLYAFHLGILDDAHVTWITAHELGHYYWGLYVLGDQERLDWIQLALGIWSDQLYLAQRSGRTLPEQWRDGRRQGDWFADWLEAVVAGHEQRLGLARNGFDFDYNSLIRHGKAATGLYLQSLLLGPDAFLDLQREILASHRHRPLTEQELIRLLVDAGLDDAPAFFDAWRQDGARIEVMVTAVEPADPPGSWRVGLARTGSVPYPVAVEVTTESGETRRHLMAAAAREDEVLVSGRPAAVRLDPDGAIPMWNGSHPGIRSAWARALERAGIDGAFLTLAPRVLEEAPDDHYLRYRLARRLFTIGRWDESAELWPTDGPCDAYDACLAALYSARARARSGDVTGAESMLAALRAGSETHGAAAFWETVRAEADAAAAGQ